MISVPIFHRSMIIVVLLASSACGKNDAPEVTETHQDVQAETGACKALALLYCENARISCYETEQLLSGAGVPESACADAGQDFELLLQSLDASDRILLPRVVSQHLVKVILKSPSLSDTQRAEFEALAVDPKLGESGQRYQDTHRTDVICPGVSSPKGEMPPLGTERWCERDAGLRHGSALTWNAHGELVRIVEYVDDKAVDVLYDLPQSQLLPPDLFLCPNGLNEQCDGSADSQSCWCTTKSGIKDGPELRWEGEHIVSAFLFKDGEVVHWEMSRH